MRTIELSEYRQLDKLGWKGTGIVQMTDHDSGEQMLCLVPRKFEDYHPEVKVCPTYDLVTEWLRDEKGIALNIIAHDGGKYHWTEVFLPNFKEKDYKWHDYREHPLVDSYDEALIAGVRTMLNLLTDKAD